MTDPGQIKLMVKVLRDFTLDAGADRVLMSWPHGVSMTVSADSARGVLPGSPPLDLASDEGVEQFAARTTWVAA